MLVPLFCSVHCCRRYVYCVIVMMVINMNVIDVVSPYIRALHWLNAESVLLTTSNLYHLCGKKTVNVERWQWKLLLDVSCPRRCYMLMLRLFAISYSFIGRHDIITRPSRSIFIHSGYCVGVENLGDKCPQRVQGRLSPSGSLGWSEAKHQILCKIFI